MALLITVKNRRECEFKFTRSYDSFNIVQRFVTVVSAPAETDERRAQDAAWACAHSEHVWYVG